MIGDTPERTWTCCTANVPCIIDNLPGHPARLVQLRVSVGLLTDGSSSLSAFPGQSPVALFEKGLAAYSCGGSFVSRTVKDRGEFPVISLRKPTPVPSQSPASHQAVHFSSQHLYAFCDSLCYYVTNQSYLTEEGSKCKRSSARPVGFD
jgi:hypothetical protein